MFGKIAAFRNDCLVSQKIVSKQTKFVFNPRPITIVAWEFSQIYISFSWKLILSRLKGEYMYNVWQFCGYESDVTLSKLYIWWVRKWNHYMRPFNMVSHKVYTINLLAYNIVIKCMHNNISSGNSPHPPSSQH